MEVHYIPFESNYIIYRPLLPLAFLGNTAMVAYIRQKMDGKASAATEVETYLRSLGFWDADPPGPRAWVPDQSHRPTTAVLLMTSACNLRCSYCYAFGGEGPLRRMTLPVAKSMIDTVWANAKSKDEAQFSLVFHGGGEPTANWGVLTESVRYAHAKDLGCMTTMATNGILDRRKRDFVMEHFSGVSLSFDGIREVQEKQRPLAGGASSFDRVMETIGAFDQAEFPYGIRMTVSEPFFGTLPESVRFLCERTRCQGIQVEPTFTGMRGGHASPSEEQARAFIHVFLQAFEVACHHGKPFFYSGATPWRVTHTFCRAAEDALIATPDGRLVTCYEIHDQTHPLADLFTVGRIEDVGASPDSRENHQGIGIHIDHRALRQFAENEASHITSCRTCFCYRHCAGDCATRRAGNTVSDPFPLGGRCHVNREITKEMLLWYIAAGGGVWRGETQVHPTYFAV